MKYLCEVIRDLLPLYKDQVCSEESKKIVEEHLRECETCKADYDKMCTEFTCISEDSSEQETREELISFFKTVEKRLSFRHIILFWSVILALMLLYLVYSSYPPSLTAAVNEAVYKAVPILDNRISIEDVEVEEVYQLENEAVYAKLTIPSPISMFDFYRVEEKNGTLESEYDYTNKEYNAVTFKKERFSLDGDAGEFTFGFVIPEIQNVYSEETESNIKIPNEGMFFVGKGGEILEIWRKGQVLEKAPEDVEERVKEEKEMLKANFVDEGYHFLIFGGF